MGVGERMRGGVHQTDAVRARRFEDSSGQCCVRVIEERGDRRYRSTAAVARSARTVIGNDLQLEQTAPDDPLLL